MHTPFDKFGKQMVEAALQAHGATNTDAEVTAYTRRIDVWFMPDPNREPVPDYLGLLGRMTRRPTTFEFYHDTPTGQKLASCLIKHGDFRHILSLRKPAPPTPMQWVISAGRPNEGINGLWLRRADAWPRGIYDAPPLLWTRLVVVSELPVARDTLLLRLLGDGGVLRRAIAELKALPADAPERMLALPILLRLRLTIQIDPSMKQSDVQEFLMMTQDIVEIWRREAIEEGVKQGLASSLIAVYEARFGAVPGDVRAVVEDTHDEAILHAWLKLVGTRGADEVTAAIRTYRTS